MADSKAAASCTTHSGTGTSPDVVCKQMGTRRTNTLILVGYSEQLSEIDFNLAGMSTR